MECARALFLLLALTLAARASGAETSLFLKSEPGDPVGGGRELAFTPADGDFTASRNFSNGVTISFSGVSEVWTLEFAAPGGARLIPGPYEGAIGFPLGSPTQPGVHISSAVSFCLNSIGRIDVLEVVYGSDGEVERFAADFEQRCSAEGALLGRVRFDASGPPFPPPPDQDGDEFPDGVDNCPTVANPEQGDTDLDRIGDACDSPSAQTFISLESEPGDFIGQGQTIALTPEEGTIRAIRIGSGVNVHFLGEDVWVFEFAPPSGADLVPGAYEGATLDFPDPRMPGLRVTGAHRGCSTAAGRFDVLEADYGFDGRVERFAADFEQHCEGEEPALFGSVRFNLAPPVEAVSIEIQPGPRLHLVNVRSRGVLRVAILGSGTFDVRDVSVSSVAFGPGGAPAIHERGRLADVNGDELDDLVLGFRVRETGIELGQDEACLTGEAEGRAFEGCDEIGTVSLGKGVHGRQGRTRRGKPDRR